MTNKDIEELKDRIEELERVNKPSEFKPEPYQRYDPTANMSMPRSVMQEMANVIPDRVIKEVALRDARLSPVERSGALPRSQQPTSPRPSAGDGSGWAHETPIGPPPGIHMVDALCIADDIKNRRK
jgi:hypothetical protein